MTVETKKIVYRILRVEGYVRNAQQCNLDRFLILKLRFPIFLPKLDLLRPQGIPKGKFLLDFRHFQSDHKYSKLEIRTLSMQNCRYPSKHFYFVLPKPAPSNTRPIVLIIIGRSTTQTEFIFKIKTYQYFHF